ncbi:hypothetical protein AAHA92_01310 [Salvia divinorum]|uniref:Uncharacterized protein n=1 Tax=Salvia divinorum TaxID=28513 RepID=A0ABD1IMZ7_SALDI
MAVSRASEPENIFVDLNLPENIMVEEVGMTELGKATGEMGKETAGAVETMETEQEKTPAEGEDEAAGAVKQMVVATQTEGGNPDIVEVRDDSVEDDEEDEIPLAKRPRKKSPAGSRGTEPRMSTSPAVQSSPPPLPPQEEEREKAKFTLTKGRTLIDESTDEDQGPSETEEEADESHYEEKDEGGSVYNKFLAKIDKWMITKITTFDTPKQQEAAAARVSRSRAVKSGKRMDQPSLRGLGAEEEFVTYISAIGFDWLLETEMPDVPVIVAQEFFSTFKFRPTKNVLANCISFRIFGTTLRMSLTEWSVRLGLYSEEQAEAGAWLERDRGQPRSIEDFDAQAVWESITENVPLYKATQSRAIHVKRLVLRLAQVFLGYNVLGQADSSSSITLTELYFMWCMTKQRKVHLGYWLAHTCNQIVVHAIRNLNTCHILGEFLKRNVVMRYKDDILPPTLCPKPEIFSITFFVRVKIVKIINEKYYFYTTEEIDDSQPKTLAITEGKAEKTQVHRATKEKKEKKREWRARMEAKMDNLTKEMDENSQMQKELLKQLVENTTMQREYLKTLNMQMAKSIKVQEENYILMQGKLRKIQEEQRNEESRERQPKSPQDQSRRQPEPTDPTQAPRRTNQPPPPPQHKQPPPPQRQQGHRQPSPRHHEQRPQGHTSTSRQHPQYPPKRK